MNISEPEHCNSHGFAAYYSTVVPGAGRRSFLNHMQSAEHSFVVPKEYSPFDGEWGRVVDNKGESFHLPIREFLETLTSAELMTFYSWNRSAEGLCCTLRRSGKRECEIYDVAELSLVGPFVLKLLERFKRLNSSSEDALLVVDFLANTSGFDWDAFWDGLAEIEQPPQILCVPERLRSKVNHLASNFETFEFNGHLLAVDRFLHLQL